MTITEKILSKGAAKKAVKPGDNVWVDVDVLMTHDVCGPGTIAVFEEHFGKDAKVWDNEKIVIIPDHYIFTEDTKCHRNIDILREFASKQDIKYYYDVGTDNYKGVCHIALSEEGHSRPGEIMFGTDSHTCTAGAFGMFSTGIGNTEAGFIMGEGRLWVKVPETMRFILRGEKPSYISAKDVILAIIGDIGVDGATYRTMEFLGDGIANFNMDERMTLCNMAIEAGGKNGIIEPDELTLDFVGERTDRKLEPMYADKGSKCYRVMEYDLSKLEPVVAKPHSPDNKALAREVNVKVDRAYIGSCTGGKITDFHLAAQILEGEKVKVQTYIIPSTKQVYDKLWEDKVNGKSLAKIFEDAGCEKIGPPSCAACLGGPLDTYGRLNEKEVCISTTNRNFPGRMGSREAAVYLASPITVASSALRGVITDPREYVS